MEAKIEKPMMGDGCNLHQQGWEAECNFMCVALGLCHCCFEHEEHAIKRGQSYGLKDEDMEISCEYVSMDMGERILESDFC